MSFEISKNENKDRIIDRNIRLLLFGTSGNGVSSSGNSILGKNVFPTSNDSESVQKTIFAGSTKFEDYVITVVDIPGINTDNQNLDVFDSFQTRIKEAFQHNECGFTALVFVLKYGDRFTKQEHETLKCIKATFGCDVIKDHAILLLTHGDMYKDSSKDVQTWCKEQSGKARDLFEECHFRCVLFNNVTESEDEQEKQIRNVFKHIQEVTTYSPKMYEAANSGRSKIKDDIAAQKQRKETYDIVNALQSKIDDLESSKEFNINQQIKVLEQIFSDFQQLESRILKDELENMVLIKTFRLQMEAKIKLKKAEENLNKFKSIGKEAFNRNNKFRRSAPAKPIVRQDWADERKLRRGSSLRSSERLHIITPVSQSAASNQTIDTKKSPKCFVL